MSDARNVITVVYGCEAAINTERGLAEQEAAPTAEVVPEFVGGYAAQTTTP